MIKTTATLVDKYDSPSGNVSFLLFQADELFQFSEGQFMMIEADCWGSIIKKPYSIATTNQQLQETKQIGFYVKKVSEQGLSSWFTSGINIGDSVTLQGALGHYINKTEHYNDNYLFISIGSGLSPNLGLFQHLVYESKKFNKIVSLFGERNLVSTIPSIITLLKDHGDDNITTMNYLSQENPCPEAFHKGRIQEGLKQALKILGTENVKVFLCGKREMVKEVKTILLEQGITKESFIVESW